MSTTNAPTNLPLEGFSVLSNYDDEQGVWIQNVSLPSILSGDHSYVPGKTALISIRDICTPLPNFKKEFTKVLPLEFLDLDEESELAIQPAHATAIADFLIDCYDEGTNVVVHCHAGICRSGGVASAGEVLGFKWKPQPFVHPVYAPNLRVKRMVLSRLWKKTGK